ncbi:hypothetical protein EVA_11656 [gut metagenome]|uniref:Uncharacterized protein n=1 Tax=gut metagenome TaxID=749906 RepID=J9GKN4_9ZZZZ
MVPRAVPTSVRVAVPMQKSCVSVRPLCWNCGVTLVPTRTFLLAISA